MKKYFFIALAATALASCSSDEVVELNEGNEIKFTAIADNDSRAATIYCNDNLMQTFNVSAKAGAANFMVDEIFTKGDGTIYTPGTSRYWPESASLALYAYNLTSGFDLATGTVKDFSPSTTIAEQVDFVYAFEPAASKPANGGALALNFRHALSQIEFRAKVEDPNILVEIVNVEVGNAYSKGTFSFPTTSTVDGGNNNNDHSQTGNPTLTNTSVGKWTLTSNKYSYSLNSDLTNAVYVASYNVNKTDAGYSYAKDASGNKVTANSKPITATNAEQEGMNYANFYANSMLLLPQFVDKNDTNTADATEEFTTAWTKTDKTGTYLAVKCRIYNVLENADGTLSTVLLYGETAGKLALVPVQFGWEPGKKYVYTFNFTKGGNGGYDEEGNDVLVPITVDVDVDDFYAADDNQDDSDETINENMQTTETTTDTTNP